MTITESLGREIPTFVHWFPSDKVLHFLGYFALATWFGGVTRPKRYPMVAALLIALGGAIEIAQGLIGNGRSAEWLDCLANALGVTIGLGIAHAGLGMWTVWVERLLGAQE